MGSRRTLDEAEVTIACLSRRSLDCAHGEPVARSARLLRQVEQRFHAIRGWVKADVFIRLFEACSDEPDMEYAMVDATIVKVHRHGQGAKG